ncbi:hypothetical protein SAMN05443247_08827 [Bradyrhizobium erythrophlei]|nr:hypothetical protein SAMN05443247_08827 [Bradyrhizobium erythrophlei]
MAGAVTDVSWLTGIERASPQALGLAMLATDPHAWRLDRSAQLAAVSDALADGATTARNLHDRFAGLRPRGIALELGLAVEATDDDPLVGSIWRFAEYRPRPPSIKLYDRGLAALEYAVCGSLAKRLLGSATPQDVFIAHELYHHAEAIRTGVPIARRHQTTLFRIGSWHWQTGIAVLAEIAAGAFAQSLLDLPYHPRVLDFAALDAISKLRHRLDYDRTPTREGRSEARKENNIAK